MRRFTEVLFLVACTLLPSLFVNGFQELQSTVDFKPQRRNTVIRGLLVSRQGLCNPGFVGCEAIGCCPIGWNCCSDGNCCDPTTYCALASNGIIGCCPNGEVCTGPVGGPTTINVPPPTNTLPAPPPPTLPPPTVPPPSPTFNSLPPSTQTTINPVPVPTVTAVPTFISSSPAPGPITLGTGTGTGGTTTTTGPSLPQLGAAGRTELYRPLLVLVGILLAMI